MGIFSISGLCFISPPCRIFPNFSFNIHIEGCSIVYSFICYDTNSFLECYAVTESKIGKLHFALLLEGDCNGLRFTEVLVKELPHLQIEEAYHYNPQKAFQTASHIHHHKYPNVNSMKISHDWKLFAFVKQKKDIQPFMYIFWANTMKNTLNMPCMVGVDVQTHE